MLDVLRIATRKSALALWQANYIKQQLLHFHPALRIELVEMTTQGDKILDVPLAKIGGKGLFVKELENALLRQQADIAVHSSKDLPVAFPNGLELAVVCQREDPRDAFISQRYQTLYDLPKGACLGTSSLRRQCQIYHLRPDIHCLTLRGNVNTRLNKLDAGEYDAIVLASAGLKRLGLSQRISSYLTVTESLPAVGQGTLAIEARQGDAVIQRLIACLNNVNSHACLLAERAVNQHLQGGCQVPIAAYAEKHAKQIVLHGLVGQPDGAVVLRASAKGSAAQPIALGTSVAENLLNQGAGKILEAVYADQ